MAKMFKKFTTGASVLSKGLGIEKGKKAAFFIRAPKDQSGAFHMKAYRSPTKASMKRLNAVMKKMGGSGKKSVRYDRRRKTIAVGRVSKIGRNWKSGK